MKFLKRLTFVLLLTVVFASCNNDDDKNSSDSLIGTWKLTAEKYNGVPYQLDECELKSTLKFTDTKVTNTEYDGTDCADVFTETYSYTKNGNTLMINADGDIVEMVISNLNATTLELTEVDTEDNDIYITIYSRQ